MPTYMTRRQVDITSCGIIARVAHKHALIVLLACNPIIQ